MSDKKINEEAPCILACPIRQDARDYVQLIARGRFSEAYRLVGREILYLRHAAASVPILAKQNADGIALKPQLQLPGSNDFWATIFQKKPGKISQKNTLKKLPSLARAPAGLAAANDLALLGYSCTIFESNPTPGGMLRMGVPPYRLPERLLTMTSNLLKKLGVEIKYHTTLGADITFDSLKKEGFSAIFISVGLLESRTLNIEGVNLDGVLKGVSFLHEANTTGNAKIGKNVLVIGGGAVAMDCARTALRLKPDKVSVACLESRKEMPTTDFEIEETIHEGAILYNSVGPKRIVGEKRNGFRT